MYGTKAAFDYITVGGRCAYETNKAFEFPAQTFHARSCLYITEHDDILCVFMDTASYVEILFGTQIESAKYYMLRLVYFVKNVKSLKLNITWKKEGDPSFCGECYEHVVADVSSNKFLYIDIDLRQNSEWVGNITNLRVGVYNTEIVPLFIRYLSVYSPTTYTCSKPACPYYSNYSTPCGAGKDLHILSGSVFEENSVNIVSDSSFLFTVYDIDFIVEIDSNNYFLNNILNEINEFFKTMPVPGLNINLDENRIKLTCNYVKPVIKHTEISEKFGFFDAFGNNISTYTVENSGNSDYIDVAGNLKGVYKTTSLKVLNFSKTFSVGFKDDGDMAPGSTFEFLDQTVIFHTLVVQFDGYINCFEIYCKALSGGGKILIFRRDGDIYKVVGSYNISATIYMEKQTIDWACNVYKGDVIGVYNLKLYISKKTSDSINHYGAVEGYSGSINKSSIENVSFSAISLYAYFKSPTANDIPIVAVYNEAAYVDRVSFLLEYSDSDLSFFNVIFNNMFNHEITGCQINVKDQLEVVTEVPGEIIDVGCLSDNVFFASSYDSQLDISDEIPPIFLSSVEDRDVLRYSWAKIITDMYKSNNYTYTFITGDVFFYYEFPTTIDICKVAIYSEEEKSVDNYLLKILDNTKISPSFSNVHDVIILDTQIKDWVFDIEGCTSTKGAGVFVYNYGELPNISFAEIEFYTSIGSIPEYVIEVTATTYDNYVVPFGLDTNGTRNNVYVGSHIKNLTFNVEFITDSMLFNLSGINIYSSYVPDDYFVSGGNFGEGTLKIYNTRSKALKCYLLDYNIDLLNNLIYEYDFDNEVLHRGFVPIKYTHDKFYFTSSNYLNDKYTTYALKNLINTEDFFITKSYNFNSQTYEDWYVPYDYLVPGYDGQFVYIDGGLTLKPLGSEAIRWFNYINTNEFYNDIDIELKFDYVGNMEDFVFIGITCCDRDYNNYLKFYGAFQFSPEYGLEFQLEGEPEPTYYKFAAILGRDAGLKINKRGNSWTFSCFYSGEWHELTTFSLFDTEILISISTLFNAPAVEGNVIAEFKSCSINASKIIHGKKVWYTVNDGLSYVYGGCVLDNSTILDNISKPLTFPREHTVEKFIYDFNMLSTKYLKFVNTQAKSIKITEIKCYLDDMLLPIKQGFISYSDDLFFGTLKVETDYLDDNVIINESLSESICKGADGVLSAVGVEFSSNVGVNKAVVYYIKETGAYEPLRITYSYDNITYYDAYDNFSLFSKTSNTSVHCLFNEFSGYKGTNEIIYDFVSNNQYSTDFSTEGVQEYKWTIQSPYVVDSGGVWLKNITGPESLYSKFSIDSDFTIDMYFDNFSNYSSGDAKVYLKVVFKNDTYNEDVYFYQDFYANKVSSRVVYINIESGRTSGGLRIKREGSIFYYYYRRYGTTWYEVGSYDYGYDYIYPVNICVCVSGDNSFDLRIKKVLITEGTGVSDTDFLLIEAPSVNTLFVRGRQFSNTNTYAVAERWGITELSYPFSFSLLHCVNSSIVAGELLVCKPYSFGLTYEGKDLSLQWFSEYCIILKIDNVLSYSATINSITSLSVDGYNADENLFTSLSNLKTKAIYKARHDVNTIIDENFCGTVSSGVSLEGDCSYIDGNYIKLVGGVVRTNKNIRSANIITFECSVVVECYSSNYYGVGLVVCNTPYRNGVSDSSGESIHVLYYKGTFQLFVNGSPYSYILNGGWDLFCPVHGQPYTIGIKFIPGTGTVIYWQGPTNGYFVFDYIINGDLYAWWGNMYGQGTYRNHITRIHRFRCFEENIPYKELTRGWVQSVGMDDYFLSSEGSSPNNDRWNVIGSPKIYNYSLKIIEQNGDKIQSKGCFCAPFEIIFDYSNLIFDVVEDSALSLNIESYDIYRDRITGTSKFKVGYKGGSGCWVNYYCGDSSGDSSIYHTSDVSNRKLKVVNDGHEIQYLLSDGANWITIESLSCDRQYYYKVLIEGTESSVVFYINSISFSVSESLIPTDAICLIPTSWKFSPTDKAYYCANTIPLYDIINSCKHFSIDCVTKIDNSMFLSYIELDKNLVIFNGAIVVGDNYSTLASAIDSAEDGQVIYVLPGSYNLGGYTITKKVLIVGIGDYDLVNIIINNNSVILNNCSVIFKNLTILEQMPFDTYSFKVQGIGNSYITLDNCKYTAQLNNNVYIFKIETANLFVYMRKCYIYRVASFKFSYSINSEYSLVLDILNCRIELPRSSLLPSNYYIIRSEIYSDISLYEPEFTDLIPVLTLFSPEEDTSIYLNTPNGMEKKITCNVDVFNYLSFGNCLGGIVFYGGKNDYYFSNYYMPPIDESCKLFIQGYIDTIRVFNNYQTYEETLNNITTVDNLGLDLRLAHNGTIVEYKIYEPLNLYDSSLYLGQGTQSVVDEFIWSKAKTTTTSMAAYYNSYLEKLGFLNCNIQIDSTKYKFFIDFGSSIGVGSLIQSVLHNFTNTVYYSDDVSDPTLLNTVCSLSEARWYSLYNDVSQHISSLTPGKFSVFPSISGCDESRWEYTGESGYIDVLPDSVLNASSGLNDIYNIKWKRNKISIDEYFVSNFSDSLTVSLKLFGGGTCNRIEIKSGYDIGTEFAGYITKCSILIDGVSRFSIDNNINSIITADFSSISFSTIDIVIEEVKQVTSFSFNNTMLTGNAVFINYVKVLSVSSSRTFSDTLCNVYEFDSPIKLDSIDTSKNGTCSLDYYYSEHGVDGCITTAVLDLDNLPNSGIRSVLVESDNLYDCGFAINEYIVDIASELMKSSIESWLVYVGDVEIYEELFYLQGTSVSVGLRFFKETVFEVGTYYEDFGTNTEWAITDELVLNIYSSNPVSSFYVCIGNKNDGIYYRWDFNLSSGWNNLRFNFYGAYVTKYSFSVLTDRLLFNDLAIFNVWCGGVYQYGDGFVVLDGIFIDISSVPNTLSSHKDAFYVPVSFESESGSIHMDYKSYWNNDGLIFGDMLSDKTILSVFGDELCFSLVNKISGKFVLGVYSYKHNVRTVKSFGYAQKFDVNDVIKLRLDWSCQGNRFSSDLYINGSLIGRVIFSLVETDKLKVTGIMVGGGSVNITSIFHSLSLCGQLKYIKMYSSNVESKITNDRLLIKYGGDWKNLVDNSPLFIGEIQPSQYVSLPVKYEGKSKELNQLNLKVKWVGVY